MRNKILRYIKYFFHIGKNDWVNIDIINKSKKKSKFIDIDGKKLILTEDLCGDFYEKRIGGCLEPHRLGGPAVESLNGYKQWWYEGENINCSSQKEFERILKLKLFW
jgi:hypothetical protein